MLPSYTGTHFILVGGTFASNTLPGSFVSISIRNKGVLSDRQIIDVSVLSTRKAERERSPE